MSVIVTSVPADLNARANAGPIPPVPPLMRTGWPETEKSGADMKIVRRFINPAIYSASLPARAELVDRAEFHRPITRR